jgi:hypothetical protein
MIIIVAIVAAVVVAAPFIARYALDSRQTPDQQLDKLTEHTSKETVRIMGDRKYSVQVTERRCMNQGPGEFFAFGRDTVWCTYTARIHSDQTGRELRKLIETAGWKRKLYDDGSGSDYKRGASTCFVYDGNTYHSRKEAEETYVDGLFQINCQSYTEHYHSTLPPPQVKNYED